MNKEQILRAGWTVEKLIERIKGCRKYQIDYINKDKAEKDKPWRTYRQLNANFYCRYKQMIALISN